MTERPADPHKKLLGNLNYLLLMNGRIISNLGDELNSIAIPWLVLEATGSTMAMGILFATGRAISFLTGLIGGVVADWLDRKKLMVSVNLLRALLFATLAWFVFINRLAFWQVLLIIATSRFLEAFFDPADDALLPSLVSKEQIARAEGIAQMLRQLTSIIGPALGGFIVRIWGYVLGIALNALSFAGAALSIFLIRGGKSNSKIKRGEESCPPLLHALIEGFTFAMRTRAITIIIVLLGISNFSFGPQGVLMPFFVQDRLNGDAAILGLLWAAFTLGTILGNLFIGALGGRWIRPGSGPLFLFYALQGLLVMAFAVATTVWWAIVTFGLFGLVNGLVNVALAAIVQQETPGDKLGRIWSIIYSVNAGMLSLSYAISGWLGSLFGPAPVITGGGLLLIAASITTYISSVRSSRKAD